MAELRACSIPRMPGSEAVLLTGMQLAALVKDVADLSDPSPVDAEHVYQQLLANYEPKGIEWVRELSWVGPVEIPLDHIDWSNEDSWAANHQKKRVKRFARRIRDGGSDVKPVILVRVPGNQKDVVIDGHHRALAYRSENMPVKAYIGNAPSAEPDDPWFQAHLYQVHSGDSPLNKQDAVGHSGAEDDTLLTVASVSSEWDPISFARKTAGGKIVISLADLVKVGPEGYIHGWICVRPPCGEKYAEARRESHGGKTVHPDGTVIGRDLKKEADDAGYKIRYQPPDGGRGIVLSGQYRSRQDAAKAAVLLHNIRVAMGEAQGDYDTGMHLERARAALINGDHAGAAQHVDNASLTARAARIRSLPSHLDELSGAVETAQSPVSVVSSLAGAGAPSVMSDVDLNRAKDIQDLLDEYHDIPGFVRTQLETAIKKLSGGKPEHAVASLHYALSHGGINANMTRKITNIIVALREDSTGRKQDAGGWQQDLRENPDYVIPESGFEVRAHSVKGDFLSLHPHAELPQVPRYFKTQEEVDDFIHSTRSAWRYNPYWSYEDKKKPTVKATVGYFMVHPVRNGTTMDWQHAVQRYPGEITVHGKPGGNIAARIPIHVAPRANPDPQRDKHMAELLAVDARDQLEHQSTLVPSVVVNTHIIITPAVRLSASDKTLADYESRLPNASFIGHMRLLPDIFAPVNAANAERTLRRCVNSGWWVPVDDHWKLSDVVMAHEVGHGVAGRAWGKAAVPQSAVFWRDFTQAVGVTAAPTAFTYDGVNRWLGNTRHRDDVKHAISVYGITDTAEMMAELWCEYSMSSNPRRPARVYGEYVMNHLSQRGDQ